MANREEDIDLYEDLGKHLAHAVRNLAVANVGDVSNPSRNMKKYKSAVEQIKATHGAEAAKDFHTHAQKAAGHLTGSSAAAEDSGNEFFKHMSEPEKASYHKHFTKLLGESFEEDLEMQEETLAASTLKPGAKSVSDDKSKLSLLSSIMSAAGGMSKDDLNYFAAVLAQFGPGKDYGVGDNSAKNSATIDMKTGSGPKTKDGMPKLNVKEDIEAMFQGQDLSEDFKESVETLFEAAISARLTLETARLEEQYEVVLQEELASFQEEVSAKLDSYLDYVVEQWMEQNQVAIESTLRNEVMEEFMDGLRNLFAEHYIDVPEQKIDVIEALSEKVEALEGKLDEVISENSELKGVLSEARANEIFVELSADLALTQQEKFASLAEGIEFDGNLATFEKKLKIIKENYFRADNSSHSSNIVEETFEGELAETVQVDPSVNRYVQAIAKTIKR